jgi:long-chain acyl-CoA synthetase
MNSHPAGFIDLFLSQVETAPEDIAIQVDGSPGVSYGALKSRMERARGALLAHGISAPYELAPILADAKPCAAIVATRDLAPTTCAVVLTPDDLDACPSTLVAPADDAVVSCHFTYKGLGYPLGVLHRYSSYSYCLEGLVRRYAGSARATHLGVLPLYPVYALLAGVMMPLALGARLLLVPRLDRGGVFELLAKHRVRYACLVPLLFRELASERRPLAQLHPDCELVSGGSYLDATLTARVAESIGVEPRQGYGLTETLPVTSNHEGASRPGTLGLPIHEEMQIGIVDAQGRSTSEGRVGQVTVGGPTVMAGYLDRPQETARFLKDRAFYTGDLGRIDEDGYLWFEGRALAITKCASQMVDLREIEQVVLRHPEIGIARAAASIDPATGMERTTVAVVPRRHSSITPPEVIEHVRAYLSRHKVPRVVKIMSAERQLQAGRA